MPVVSPPLPTFALRFESRDDFLVEYADRLRDGFVLLPLGEHFAAGTPIRLRLHLPDRAVLYLTAVAIDAPRAELASEGRWLRLIGLTEAQRQTLRRCVEATVGSAESASEPIESAPAHAPTGEGLSVLLVEDLVGTRVEVAEALRARGLRVRVADNGLTALASIIKRLPQVVLTDVEMPQMDGWGLLRSIRQRASLVRMPVVFHSALTDDASRLRGYRQGVDDYLAKGTAPEEIVARLHGAVARRHQLPSSTDVHGLRGDLEQVRLGSVLAFLESERRSGALHLRCGGDSATLHLRDGAFSKVDNLGRYTHPHDRVFELLGWSRGQFDFITDELGTGGESTPLSYLLLEHARRIDESAAIRSTQHHAGAVKASY